MAKRKVLGRRDFLSLSVAAVGAVALASCAPTPPPSPTKAPAPAAAPTSAPVAPTAAPAAKAPAAAAPTATAAPAPAATKAPVVAPTTAPAAVATKAPAVAAPPETKIGKSLIGKLEGPEIITDPGKFPKELKEPPALAELVKAGKLPPVKERIGQDPLVVKPVHEIGKYGGTWRLGFTGPGDFVNGIRAASGTDFILSWDFTGDKVVPNIAKSWEFSEGGRVFTLHLRRGMKWSDGHPYTADDYMFWYQDMYQNKDLVPTPIVYLHINQKPGVMEKVDDYTVRWKYPDPYYLMAEVMAASTPLAAHSYYGRDGHGSHAPAHYLKQFHPKYVSKDELDKKVKEAGYDNWVKLFKFKNDWSLNPELPVLSVWKTASPANTPNWIFERNPYSIWVDTEGNQLPYIDRVVLGLAENLEVLNLRAIAGEFDLQSRHIDLGKLPVFLENQQKGNYRVYLDPANHGADMALRFNLNYDADPEVAKWLTSTDFRRALSLGIDRDQINEVFWLGTGTPGSVVPAEVNPYNPGPEYRTLWSTLDPKKADEMLGKLGLGKKDGEGFRLRSDGKERLRIELETWGGQFLQFTQIAEMIREHWKKIGIDISVKEVERSLAQKRAGANELHIDAWTNDGSDHPFTFPNNMLPYDSRSAMGPLYGTWLQSGGKQGKEPTGRLREALDMWVKAFGVPDDERVKLGKEMWKIFADEVFIIGVVGISAAAQGVRIAKVNLGNNPSRMTNSPDAKNPAINRPQTFFWK